MVSYGDLVKRLKCAGIESPEFEASVLLDYISDENVLENVIRKRIDGYPLQYIIGEWDFYDLTLFVGEGVLIPRQDTETLVDEALKVMKDMENPRVLDLCSGSGAVVIALKEHHKGEYFALEKEEAAFGFLRKNCEKYGGGITLLKGDLSDMRTIDGISELDIITANPPYLTDEDMEHLQKEVTFEPEAALRGGSDGLCFYRCIAENYRDKLTCGGKLLFEVGAAQADDVVSIMKGCGLKNVRTTLDLCKKERVVIGERC